MQCGVCEERVAEAVDAMVTGCGHGFCWSCLREWLHEHQRRTCPVCRTNLVRLLHHHRIQPLACVSYTTSSSMRQTVNLACGFCGRAECFDPVLLMTCGHIFCWPCLLVSVNEQLAAGNELRLRCCVPHCLAPELPAPLEANLCPVYANQHVLPPQRPSAAAVMHELVPRSITLSLERRRARAPLRPASANRPFSADVAVVTLSAFGDCLVNWARRHSPGPRPRLRPEPGRSDGL